jgi:hypothetical protein
MTRNSLVAFCKLSILNFLCIVSHWRKLYAFRFFTLRQDGVSRRAHINFCIKSSFVRSRAGRPQALLIEIKELLVGLNAGFSLAGFSSLFLKQAGRVVADVLYLLYLVLALSLPVENVVGCWGLL